MMLAMDARNVKDLSRQAPTDGHARISLLLDAAYGEQMSIPDPYTGTEGDFETVFETVDRALRKLIQQFVSES